MATYTMGFIPLDAVNVPQDVNTQSNDGFISWGGNGYPVQLNYSNASSLRIDDENGSFDDDPFDPEWSPGNSEVSENGIVRHSQRNADPMTIGEKTYAPGTLQLEAEYRVELQDAEGNIYLLVGISAYGMDGKNESWPYNPPPHGIIGFTFAGENGWPPENAALTFLKNDADGPSIPWSSIPKAAPCFTRGVLISTQRGEVAVEDLRVGDLVLTRDNGLQPIRWIGSKKLSKLDLVIRPELCPIRIAAGALGKGLPTSDLLVSPQHRVLVRSRIAQRMFGATEVLVAAKQLLQVDGIDIAENVDGVEYFHLLFDRHEIVISNGAETESLYTGPEALKAVGKAALKEIFEIFPEMKDREYLPGSARLLLSGRQSGKLAARHQKNCKPLYA